MAKLVRLTEMLARSSLTNIGVNVEAFCRIESSFRRGEIICAIDVRGNSTSIMTMPPITDGLARSQRTWRDDDFDENGNDGVGIGRGVKDQALGDLRHLAEILC